MKENTIALALLSALLVAPAAAQNDDAKAELVKLKPNDFPTAPIEYTVVYPAGGGMDVTARFLAKYVEKWSETAPAVRAWSATLISPPKPSPTDTRLASSPI